MALYGFLSDRSRAAHEVVGPLVGRATAWTAPGGPSGQGVAAMFGFYNKNFVKKNLIYIEY